jgi:hypothetical protein
MAAALVAGAFALQWWVEHRPPPPAPAPFLPHTLQVALLRSEVSAVKLSALVKVFIRARNDGNAPVHLGPGSFWLLDAGGVPYLDRYAAEQPYATKVTLEPGQEGKEIGLKFQMPPAALRGTLVLLVGPAPIGAVTESNPPPEPVRVLVKEDGAPKGQFYPDKWRTYTSTRWQ